MRIEMVSFFLMCATAWACASSPNPPAQRPDTPTEIPAEPPPATAAPRTIRLASAYKTDRNERCGGSCRFRQHGHSRLTLTIAPNGAAHAEDQGYLRREYRGVDGNREEITKWKHHWRGSWAQKHGRFVLQLDAAQSDCERQSHANAERVPCGPKPATLKLVCRNIDLSSDDKRVHSGWQCRGRGLRRQDATRGPWLFGSNHAWHIFDHTFGREVRLQQRPNSDT